MTKYNAYYLICKTGVINLELEEIISKDWFYFFCYARNVLKDRFKLGELTISKHGYYSCDYAIEILRYNHA